MVNKGNLTRDGKAYKYQFDNFDRGDAFDRLSAELNNGNKENFILSRSDEGRSEEWLTIVKLGDQLFTNEEFSWLNQMVPKYIKSEYDYDYESLNIPANIGEIISSMYPTPSDAEEADCDEETFISKKQFKRFDLFVAQLVDCLHELSCSQPGVRNFLSVDSNTCLVLYRKDGFYHLEDELCERLFSVEETEDVLEIFTAYFLDNQHLCI